MKEFVYYGELFNIYGFLLTKKQQDITHLYYEENLSLQEIADEFQVSKSYVGKTIADSRKKLDYFEQNIKHYELLQKVNHSIK